MFKKISARMFGRLSPGIAIFVSLLIMTGSIGLFVTVFAKTHDADQIAIEQTIVQSATKDALVKLGDALRPNTYWDDGFDHITDKVDPDWAEKNLGPYAQTTSNVSALFLIGENDRPIYEFAGGEPDKNFKDYETDSALMALVNMARAKPSAPPYIATGFVEVGGRIYLGAASLLVPNDDRAMKPLARKTVEIYLQSFDSQKISKVQNDFHVSQVVLTTAPVPGATAHITLKDAAGENLAFLSWQAATPGSAFSRSVTPYALGCIFLVGFLLWSALRNWSSTVTALEHQKVEAAQARSEELRISARKAEEASAAKSAFLALMSHEIRTPMNGVLGMAGVLLDSDLGEEHKRQALVIRDSADTLLRIINDILDFSKLEAGKLDIEIAAFDLPVLFRQVCEIMAPRAHAKGLSLDIVQSVPEFVFSDPGRVRQILLNLISNALKFTERGGIHIKATSTAPSDGTAVLKIAVCDTGIGIPKDKLGRLFQSFSQTDASISRRFGGTGLGLAISKQLVERMNGEIGVESEEGHGSTFWFTLPVKIATADEARENSDSTAVSDAKDAIEFLRTTGPSLRILLVEDNATNVVVAKAVLAKFGIVPDLAGNGLEALEAVQRASYDAILMDVQMPQMDGLEATRAIRELGGTVARTPIIGLSANAFTEDVEHTRAAGMNNHVAKPFRTEQLATALFGVLSGKTLSPEAHTGNSTTGQEMAVDWDTIGNFSAECGEEMLSLLLNTFLSDGAQNLHRLEKLMRTADGRAEAARIAHSLKSGSAMAGAIAMSRIAAALEKDLKGTDAIDLAKIADMKRVFGVYRTAIVEKGLAAA